MIRKIASALRIFFIERVLARIFFKRQFERFWLVLGGHMYFQTVVTAVEIGLFDLLSKEGPLSRSEIAEKLSLGQKPIRIILLGLVSTGMLKKKGNRYTLNHISKRFFVSTSPFNIHAILKWQKYINYRAMFHLTEAVKKNTNVGLREFVGNEKTLYERLEHTPDLNQIFQDAMEDISKQAASQLAEHLDTSSTKYLIDVGGGNGTVLMSLATKNPLLRGAVMDLPSIRDISVKHVKDMGFDDRIGFVTGNCFIDPFPRQTDMILFCHFFTIWSEERDVQLLKKCYDALPKGGKVVIFNMMQRNSEDGPLSAALGSPYFLTIATGEGMLYSWNDYEEWMMTSGFQKIERVRLPMDHGILIGEK